MILPDLNFTVARAGMTTSFSGLFGLRPTRDFVRRTSNTPKLRSSTGITQQEVFEVIQQTLDGITEALATGRDVELRNFGVFEVRLTKSRVGRNPNKPENDVVIPARATVKFKSGKIMRQRVLLRTDELRGKGNAAATA